MWKLLEKRKDYSKMLQRQRKNLKLTEKKLQERITRSSLGENAKALTEKWVEMESFGGVGWGLFEMTPIMVRGDGTYLYDADGKEYIDLLAGFSVSSLGQCNKEISKIISDQAKKLVHYFDFPHLERIKLAEKLIKFSKIKDKIKIGFGVTGSDGVELAVRAARYYTGKPYILTAYGDYHGVTYGTMGLTGKGNMQPYFYPVLPITNTGFFHFPYCYRCPFDKEYPKCDMFCIKSFEKLLDSKETP